MPASQSEFPAVLFDLVTSAAQYAVLVNVLSPMKVQSMLNKCLPSNGSSLSASTIGRLIARRHNEGIRVAVICAAAFALSVLE